MASHLNVEAHSLASINQLAANPPKYPRNPTEPKRPSLVLYIARVPGKKDVILTTLKPRLKNVTAADVASSLYYFHLNTPEDDSLREELQRLQMEEEEHSNPPTSGPPAVSNPIVRKPVAASVRSIDALSRSSSLREPQSRDPPDQERISVGSGIPGHAMNSDLTDANHLHPESFDALQGKVPGAPTRLNSIGRKPLPGPENQSPRSSLQLPSSTYTQRPASLAPSTRLSNLSMLDEPPKLRHSILTGIPAPAGDTSVKSFSITMIRRDPASGAQWNIGSIRSQPMRGLTSTKATFLAENPDAQYNDISVLLTTPGYNRFPKGEMTGQISERVTNSSQPQEPWNTKDGFTRDVRMEWTRPKSPNSSRPPPLRRQDTGDSVLSTFRSRARSISDVAVLQAKNAPRALEMSKTSKPRALGYTFTSPWGGKCNFLTGTDGRSLKCKHTLPGAASHVNPMASSNQTSTVVSELRFNLPSSGAKSPVSPVTGHGEFARSAASKLSHIRNKLSSESRSSSHNSTDGASYAASFRSDDDDDDAYGIQLGQEKAGGGNRGKRAKLGKLIVHDEGLKMLDVVVAANIGVWWSSWGR